MIASTNFIEITIGGRTFIQKNTESYVTNCKSKESSIITVTLLLLKKVNRYITIIISYQEIKAGSHHKNTYTTHKQQRKTSTRQ